MMDPVLQMAPVPTLAARAYARTAAYDAAISTWFAAQLEQAAPARKAIAGTLIQTMRYGENPHQSAAFYASGAARPRAPPSTPFPPKSP